MTSKIQDFWQSLKKSSKIQARIFSKFKIKQDSSKNFQLSCQSSKTEISGYKNDDFQARFLSLFSQGRYYYLPAPACNGGDTVITHYSYSPTSRVPRKLIFGIQHYFNHTNRLMPNKLSIIRVQSHNNYCQKIRLFVLKFKQESRIKKSIKQEKEENFTTY